MNLLELLESVINIEIKENYGKITTDKKESSVTDYFEKEVLKCKEA